MVDGEDFFMNMSMSFTSNLCNKKDEKTIDSSFQDWMDKRFEETFKAIDELYKSNQEKDNVSFLDDISRLVFPQKRDEQVRVSEQELRFLFVELFSKKCDDSNNYYYSVETPTKSENCFSGDTEMSARLDMTIHDKSGKRICLIEFKNNSGTPESHWKDFVKLAKDFNELKDPQCLCYFVSIAKASDGGTIQNGKGEGIVRKFEEIKKMNREESNLGKLFDHVTYICHSIEPKGKGFQTIYARKGDNENNSLGWVLHNELFEDC